LHRERGYPRPVGGLLPGACSIGAYAGFEDKIFADGFELVLLAHAAWRCVRSNWGMGMNMRTLLCCILFAAPAAQAHLLASDSIACGGATQVGAAGGVGWSSAWIADAGQTAVFVPGPGSLAGPLGLPTLGGSLNYNGTGLNSNGARIYRPLDIGAGSAANLLGLTDSHTTFFGDQQYGYGTPGTTVWLGFLLNGGSAGNGISGVQYLAQVHLYDGLDQTKLSQRDNNKDGEVRAIGRGAGNFQWNFERTCGHSPCGGNTSSLDFLSTLAMDNQTHWVVIKFDFTSASTTNGTSITLWLGPTPGAIDPDPSTALTLSGNGQNNKKTVTVPALHFNWIEFGGQQATFAMDEMRVADTFSDLSNGASSLGCDEIFYDGFE
jgi:hypothetical protein